MTLEAGDVLVAYTDGVSEAMDAADEEWGEEQLIDAVHPNRTAGAKMMIERIMVAADAFAGSTPQYDDMTLVVARLVQAAPAAALRRQHCAGSGKRYRTFR